MVLISQQRDLLYSHGFSWKSDALGQEEQTKSFSMVYVVSGSLGKEQKQYQVFYVQ